MKIINYRYFIEMITFIQVFKCQNIVNLINKMFFIKFTLIKLINLYIFYEIFRI
jgi:hypothetical protein